MWILKSQTLDAASVLSINLNRIFAKAFVLIYVFQIVFFFYSLSRINFILAAVTCETSQCGINKAYVCL